MEVSASILSVKKENCIQTIVNPAEKAKPAPFWDAGRGLHLFKGQCRFAVLPR